MTDDEFRCYACNRLLEAGMGVYTADGELVYVGPECDKKIGRAGAAGHQFRKGRLFSQDPTGKAR